MGLLVALPGAMSAQHQPHDSARAPTLLERSQSRTASGTTWLPDAAPVPGYHHRTAGWDLMLHGSAFLQLVHVTGARAQSQLGSTNWVMAMASRTSSRHALRVRAMLTAEPFTLPGAGYPQLLQVAHLYRGALAADRQHPHELVPELSVAYEHALSTAVALAVYAAPVGEPALGPVAYNHRPSAAYEPAAPLGHVVQDYTHESLGVVTLGAFGRRARVEASAFNGSHPDDRHANFDLQGGRLNSYAGRVTVAPSARIVAAAWVGHIAAETGSHAHEPLYKFGASLLHSGSTGTWSTALVYGANLERGTTRPLSSVLLESTLQLAPRHTVFGRVEYARRTADELALTGSVPSELAIGAFSAGYAWRAVRGAATLALGARITVSAVPRVLEPFYGSRTPLGLLADLRLAPHN